MEEEIKNTLIGISIAIASTIGIGYIFYNFVLKKSNSISLEKKNVDILKLEDVIRFFKHPDIIVKLESDSDLLAVATKEKNKDKYIISLSIFNSKTSKVSDSFVIYTSKEIDEDLKNAFGDKDMIILS